MAWALPPLPARPLRGRGGGGARGPTRQRPRPPLGPAPRGVRVWAGLEGCLCPICPLGSFNSALCTAIAHPTHPECFTPDLSSA